MPWPTPELSGPCLWLQDQRARTHPADAITHAKWPLGQRAHIRPGRRIGGRLRKPPRRPCRTAPAPRPRAARRPARWRHALCHGGPGLRRRSQRCRLRPRALRHCACTLERHGGHRAQPDVPRASCWVCDICRSGFPPHPGPLRERTTRPPPPAPDPPRASCWVSDICRSGFPPHPGPSRKRTTRSPPPASPPSPSALLASSPPHKLPRPDSPPFSPAPPTQARAVRLCPVPARLSTDLDAGGRTVS